MTRTIKTIVVLLAVVGGVWLGYTKVVQRLYLEPRQAAISKINAASAKLQEYRTNLKDHPRVLSEVRAFADRTLGGDLETVDHRLRTRLSRLVEHAALKNPAVGTIGAAKAKDSPAKALFTGGNRPLRDEIDFCELEGWVSGTGTLTEALTLIDSIQAEPWIKRIDHLGLDPRDNGERFTVTVRLTTLFVPGRAPKTELGPPSPTAMTARSEALVRFNPFRVPMAAVEVAQTPAAPLPEVSGYEQWAVTGVAQSTAGIEVWLLNSQTRESRRLAVGERLDDLVLLAARGERAVFSQGDEKFIVWVGRNLSDRTPLKQ